VNLTADRELHPAFPYCSRYGLLSL
jgi:hypothetical protein